MKEESDEVELSVVDYEDAELGSRRLHISYDVKKGETTYYVTVYGKSPPDSIEVYQIDAEAYRNMLLAARLYALEPIGDVLDRVDLHALAKWIERVTNDDE